MNWLEQALYALAGGLEGGWRGYEGVQAKRRQEAADKRQSELDKENAADRELNRTQVRAALADRGVVERDTAPTRTAMRSLPAASPSPARSPGL